MKTGLETLVERLDYQIGFTAHIFAVDDFGIRPTICDVDKSSSILSKGIGKVLITPPDYYAATIASDLRNICNKQPFTAVIVEEINESFDDYGIALVKLADFIEITADMRCIVATFDGRHVVREKHAKYMIKYNRVPVAELTNVSDIDFIAMIKEVYRHVY